MQLPEPIKLLICGPPGSGKTKSLQGLPDPEKAACANIDNKPFPFMGKIKIVKLADPVDVFQFIETVEENNNYDTMILDTVSFLLNDYEDQYVAPAADSRKMWGEYGKFVRDLLRKINESKKNVIVLCHTMTRKVEETGEEITQAFCKGSVANIGIEAAFTSVLYSKVVPVSTLTPHKRLTITDEEREDGCKHVLQTRKTKKTRNESMKFIEGILSRDELYLDNNVGHIFDAVAEAYRKLEEQSN